MKNRMLGSIFIVAGTSIGAGMLAMPLASAGVGFAITLLSLFLLWALMCYTALLLVEVYQHTAADTGLSTLTRRYLGKPGQWLTGFSMLLLMYALVAAYISGAGELLTDSLNVTLSLSLPSVVGVLIFTLIGGIIVAIGTHSVDLINRILFSAKIIMLVLMLAFMMPHVRQVNLLSLPLEKGLALSALPVIFTSFGFHGSIPSIIHYMQGNRAKLRWIFIIGSAIPLVAYVLWQIATLGAINSGAFFAILGTHTGLNGLIQAVHAVAANAYIETTLNLFADLALTTSFLGVALGLFDYLADVFRRKTTLSGRLQTSLLTFAPPLIFALFYPRGFVLALGYAGIALSVLALLIPAMLAWKSRQQYPNSTYKVAGGSVMLSAVFFIGIAIIAIQLLISFGVLPTVG